MAINYPGFGPIPRADLSGIGDIVENIGKGYKIGRMPDTMREEQEGRMRENALKALRQQFMPEEYKAKIAHLHAQTQHEAQQARQAEVLMDYLKRMRDRSSGAGGGAQPSSPGLAEAPASTPSDFGGVPFRMNEPGVNEGQAMTDNPQQAQDGYMPSRDQTEAAMRKALEEGAQRYQEDVVMSGMSGGKIPAPTLKDINGTIYALGAGGKYPVAQGQTPAQKGQQDVKVSEDKLKSKMDLERAQALKEQAQSLKLGGDEISAIHELISGDKPLETGIKASIKSKLGRGSKEFGEFLERAQNIQAEMTHDLSQRGGQGAARIVAAGKVSGWKGRKENLGLSDAYAQKIKNKYDLLNDEYRTITGENLPYTLPEYVYNIAQTIHADSSKFTPKTKFDSDKEFHDYMKSLSESNQNKVIKAMGRK